MKNRKKLFQNRTSCQTGSVTKSQTGRCPGTHTQFPAFLHTVKRTQTSSLRLTNMHRMEILSLLQFLCLHVADCLLDHWQVQFSQLSCFSFFFSSTPVTLCYSSSNYTVAALSCFTQTEGNSDKLFVKASIVRSYLTDAWFTVDDIYCI